MRELRENVLHTICATHGQLLLSGMQRQNGSSQERERIQGSKRILESKDIISRNKSVRLENMAVTVV